MCQTVRRARTTLSEVPRLVSKGRLIALHDYIGVFTEKSRFNDADTSVISPNGRYQSQTTSINRTRRLVCLSTEPCFEDDHTITLCGKFKQIRCRLIYDSIRRRVPNNIHMKAICRCGVGRICERTRRTVGRCELAEY